MSDSSRHASDAVLSPADRDAPWEEPCTQVFLLTGFHPDAEILERCGLRLDPKTLKVALEPETLDSKDVPGIYLAESVGAGYETGEVFIENGRFDCEKIFAALSHEADRRS